MPVDFDADNLPYKSGFKLQGACKHPALAAATRKLYATESVEVARPRCPCVGYGPPLTSFSRGVRLETVVVKRVLLA